MSGDCPLCGRPLYAWLALPAPAAPSEGGSPFAASAEEERVLVRCESCGVALEREREVDLVAEWEAICRPAEGGGWEIAVPNRASLQAGIGGEGWAGFDLASGRLLHTPRSLALLADRTGHRIDPPSFPRLGANQAWMWQTLINGLTLHPNFAREARAGRLRPRTGRGRAAYALDVVVTLLAAPLIGLISVPLELAAALGRRGGEMVAQATS